MLNTYIWTGFLRSKLLFIVPILTTKFEHNNKSSITQLLNFILVEVKISEKQEYHK